MKRVWRFLQNTWQPAIGYGLAACFMVFLLFIKLGTLNVGWSQAELQTRAESNSVQKILDNPVNAPYKTGQYVVQKLGFNSPAPMRAVSAAVVLLAVLLFYVLIKRWHTRRIAVISTLLFATNSLVLSAGRLGTPTAMWFILVMFISVALYFRHTHRPRVALLILMTFTGLSLYVPGMVWFVALALGWQWPMLPKLFRHFKPWQAYVAAFYLLLLMAPLMYGIIRDINLLKPLFAIPASFHWQDTLTNLAEVPSMLFFKTPSNPLYWLGVLPILDIFATVMFVLGLYSYHRRLRMDRTVAIVAIFIVCTLLIALSGDINMIVLILPFVYVVVAGGVTLMLQQWFTVFPLNPLARTLGPTIISIAVLMTASYHIARYYIAWPNAPETKAVFHIRQ